MSTPTAEYRREWAAANPDKIKAHRKAHRAKHKERLQEQQRLYYAAHPEKQAARDRRKKYGMTADEFSRRLAAQGGRCAACLDMLAPGRGTHVDHCHATGKTRDLLCKPCNLALGHAKDSPTRLRALADYLEAHASLAEGAVS